MTKKNRLGVALLALVLLAGAVSAANVTWNGGNMNWSQPDSDSWSSATYNSGDSAIFSGSGQGTVNVDIGGVTPGAVDITSGSYTFSGGSISGSGTVTMSSSGTLTLDGVNTYSGGTVVYAGTIKLGADDTYRGDKALGSGTLTVAGNATVTSGHDLNPTLSNGFAVNSGVTASFSVPSFYYNINFAGPLTGDGTVSMPSGGNGNGGSVTFSNPNNTFTGTIVVGSGTSRPHAFSLGSLADSAKPVRIYTDNPLTFSGGTAPQVFNGRHIELAHTTGNSTLNNNSAAASTISINTPLRITGVGDKTLTLGGSNTGMNMFAGAITNGAGSIISLTKADGGTWVLSGRNTYSGPTTISAGRLEITGSGCLGAGGTYSGDITNNATFICRSSATQTWSGVISGSQPFLHGGSGMLKLAGVNTYIGATTVTNGALLGVTGGSCSNSSFIVTNVPGVTASLGVSVTNETMQWVCQNVTFKTNGVGAQFMFSFDVKPSTSVAPMQITGDLTFSGVPVIVVNSKDDLTVGKYPLLVAGGAAPSESPKLVMPEKTQGRLSWGGVDNKTLYLTVSAFGTVITIR